MEKIRNNWTRRDKKDKREVKKSGKEGTRQERRQGEGSGKVENGEERDRRRQLERGK